jgi:hypothetical protein
MFFYEHVRKYLAIDEQLLATITTASFTISEITEAIVNRHHSGGMKYIWQDVPEDKLSSRQQNNLFRKITSQTEGNIGLAFYMWLGNISDIKKNEIYLSDFKNQELPELTNPEWENMLTQILMHKHISLRRLKQVYQTEKVGTVENTVQSLLRTGLVLKTASNSYSISPYVIPFLTKYLHKKLEHAAA